MNEKTPEKELPSWISNHIELYQKDPDKGHKWDSTFAGGPGELPTLLLFTRGRKTGRTNTSPLIYGKQGDNYVIIASKGGAPSHPAWYLNLQANPECEIQVAHDKMTVTARTASGSEREELWLQLTQIYPPYIDYQASTSRQIPVVVLEPTG